MKKSMVLRLLVTFLAVLFIMGFSGIAAAKDIKIGGLMDCTGGTSDVGKDYAIGMAEAFKYINSVGGVNGKMIKYTWFDYGYRIPEAITKYKLLKRLGVIAIMGWGTGDTEALSPTVNKDEIPLRFRFLFGPFDQPRKNTLQPFLCIGLFHQRKVGINGLV